VLQQQGCDRAAEKARLQQKCVHVLQTSTNKQKKSKFKVSPARSQRQRTACCAAVCCAAVCNASLRTQIELVVDAREYLCDGGRVGDHADGALHLGQVAAGDNGGGLVVDAALKKKEGRKDKTSDIQRS